MGLEQMGRKAVGTASADRVRGSSKWKGRTELRGAGDPD